ncbi:MAG: hypothetical protein M1838_002446 [Thelocarpon superellum]|nr:MAG: hypothetical protein M1838_002446 [Thelocarpon superellum]
MKATALIAVRSLLLKLVILIPCIIYVGYIIPSLIRSQPSSTSTLSAAFTDGEHPFSLQPGHHLRFPRDVDISWGCEAFDIGCSWDRDRGFVSGVGPSDDNHSRDPDNYRKQRREERRPVSETVTSSVAPGCTAAADISVGTDTQGSLRLHSLEPEVTEKEPVQFIDPFFAGSGGPEQGELLRISQTKDDKKLDEMTKRHLLRPTLGATPPNGDEAVVVGEMPRAPISTTTFVPVETIGSTTLSMGNGGPPGMPAFPASTSLSLAYGGPPGMPEFPQPTAPTSTSTLTSTSPSTSTSTSPSLSSIDGGRPGMPALPPASSFSTVYVSVRPVV